jgi:exodeoxyribonuclease VII large subunit
MTRSLEFMSPQRKIDTARQTVDALAERLAARLELRLSVAQERTASLSRALDAANPAGLLSRGYSVVRKADGTTVRSMGQVSDGERLSVQVQDGAFDVRVGNGDNGHGQSRLAGF